MGMAIFSYIMFYCCAVAYGTTTSFVKYELYSEIEMNGNVISSFDTSSVKACVVRCDNTYGCLSLNFHEENEKCVLTDYYPADETKSGVSGTGWKIFFQPQFDVDLLSGATAWQSSTMNSLTADKAIDGGTDQNAWFGQSCTHTDNDFSYWAVEFGTSGPVKEVEIYLRNDDSFHINTNFTVTVSNSRDDVINGGTLCGAYFGPAIDTAPFRLTIACVNTVYGKFLKIEHGMMGGLVLCEVFVYTP